MDMQHINVNLMLRLLGIQEFFAEQWFENLTVKPQNLAELAQIRKEQSLKSLINSKAFMSENDDEDGSQTSTGSGRGTIKGFRAKDDPKIRNSKNPFSKRMIR